MAKKEIPIYELYIDDVNIEGLTAMGLVEQPAIQQNFIYFSENKLGNKYQLANVSAEQRMIVGPALIPEKKIIRQDMFGELYYVKFSKELVATLAHNFMMDNKIHLVTEQHEQPINKGVYMVESWIVGKNDKIYDYGYTKEQVPEGSYCVQYYIENDVVLSKIKSGEIKGFSIEAYLSDKLISQSKLEKLIVELEKNKEAVIEELLKMKKTGFDM